MFSATYFYLRNCVAQLCTSVRLVADLLLGDYGYPSVLLYVSALPSVALSVDLLLFSSVSPRRLVAALVTVFRGGGLRYRLRTVQALFTVCNWDLEKGRKRNWVFEIARKERHKKVANTDQRFP